MKNPEKLLDLLAQDARLTPAQLAAMLGESEEDGCCRDQGLREEFDHPRLQDRGRLG